MNLPKSMGLILARVADFGSKSDQGGNTGNNCMRILRHDVDGEWELHSI